MLKLAIIQTHPVQYYVPLYQLLAKESDIQIKVFYTWSQRQHDFFDKDFGKEIKWDIPLLDGYDYEFIENISKNAGCDSFKGIQCPQLIEKIEAWGANKVLVFGWNFDAHFKAMKYFKGKIPVLFRGDSTLLDYDYRQLSDLKLSKAVLSQIKSYIKFKIRTYYLRRIYKNIDIALYVGKHNKDYFLHHELKESQLVFAPHAVENERFFDFHERKYELRAKEWRKQLGFNDSDVVILFAGKFEPKKNPLLLLTAFLEAKKNNSNLKLLMVGNGILENEIAEISKKSSDIVILPFQNQAIMPIVYRLADVYCLPSQGPGETWGLAVNEAMACGRSAIVSSKVGCAPDLVIQGETGFVIHSQNELVSILNSANSLSLKQMSKSVCLIINNYSLSAIVACVKRLNVISTNG